MIDNIYINGHLITSGPPATNGGKGKGKDKGDDNNGDNQGDD